MRLTVLLLLLSCSVYGQPEFKKLVGRWEGIQGSDTVTFLFESDSTITMTNKKDPQVIGGRENVRKGKKVRMIYTVDASQKPFAIDMIIQEIETTIEQLRMKGIFEFIDNNEININFGPGVSRPVAFDQLSIRMIRKE